MSDVGREVFQRGGTGMDKETNTLNGQQHQGEGNVVSDGDPSPRNAMGEKTAQEFADSNAAKERVETVIDVVAGEGDERSDSPCHPSAKPGDKFEHRDNDAENDNESDLLCHPCESRDPAETQHESAQDQDVARELAQLKDHHLRLAAEFDNYKRRSEQEWQQKLKYAANGLVHELLSVLDSLEQATCAAEAALQQADHAPLRTLLEGMRMVHKQLDTALRQQGVRPLEPVGKPFDPSRHEAVGQHPDDSVAPGTVVRQAQAGYLLHDRLVRPARVVVATSDH